jgi:MFS family permease
MNTAYRPPLVPVLAWSTSQHALSMLQVFVVPAIAPAMAAGLGVTESLVGVQVILVYVTATIASLFAGSLVVRLGAVRATQLSIATGAVGLALSAVPSLPVIAVASVVLGLGYGLINPATGQMLEAAVSPERRAFAFSLKQSALPLGGVLAGLAAPGLALAQGWQGTLLLAALASLLGAALLEVPRRWLPADARAPEPGGGRAWGDIGIIWSSPPLRNTCLAVLTISGVQLTLTTYLVTLLVQHVGISLVAAGIALACLNIGGVLGRVAWGAATQALGSGSAVLTLMYGIGVLGLLAFPFMTADWPLAVICALSFLLGSVIMGSPGVFVSEVVRLAPAGEAARAIGAGYFFAFGGAQLGVLLFIVGYQVMESYPATLWLLVLLGVHGFLMSIRTLLALRVSRADGRGAGAKD